MSIRSFQDPSPYSPTYNMGAAMFGGAMFPVTLPKKGNSKPKQAEKARNELSALFAMPKVEVKPKKEKKEKRPSSARRLIADDVERDAVGALRRHTSPVAKSGGRSRIVVSSGSSYASSISFPLDRSSTSSSSKSFVEHSTIGAFPAPPKLIHSNSHSHSQSGSLITRYRSLAPEPEQIVECLPEEEIVVLYRCATVHPFLPPPETRYQLLPFLTLHMGDTLDVLSEEGHPSEHQDMPLYVDDGDDCMLVARDGNGRVGWVLASFVEPLA